MKRIFFALALLFSLAGKGAAAQVVKYVGRVVDAETLQPIPNALVEVYGSDFKTFTNVKGFFEISTDTSLHRVILISHIAYEKSDIKLPKEERLKAILHKYYPTIGVFFLSKSRFITIPNKSNNISSGTPAGFTGDVEGYFSKYLDDFLRIKIEENTNALVKFSITEKGLVVYDTMSGVFKQELVDVVRKILSEMPSWEPAVQNGVKVSQGFSFGISGSRGNESVGDVLNELGMRIIYPAQAKRVGVEGLTSFLMEIDSGGNILKITPVNSIGAGCEAAAMDALSKVSSKVLKNLVEGTGFKSFLFPIQFRLEPKSSVAEFTFPAEKVYLMPMVSVTARGSAVKNSESSRYFQMEAVSEDLEKASKNPSAIRLLHLPGKDFQKFPETILAMKQLRTLNLDVNDIESLPESIVALEKINDLYLFKNKLSALPANFSKLKTIKNLGLSANKFSAFPIEIAFLPNLEVLDLSHNNITVLPPEIGQLKALRVIYLNGNRIEDLPEIFYTLKLESIYIGENPLKPEVMERLIQTFGRKKINL